MPVQTFVTHVEDLVSVLAVFDQLQVWKSATENGTYVEVTAAAPTKATLDGSEVGPWVLTGLELVITLNNTDPQTIEFDSTDPMTLTQVIVAINAIFPSLAKELPTSTGKLRLESPTTGTASALLVSGSARTVLGLPDTKTNGKAQRVGLVNPTTEYEFRDFDGLETDWYKTRYYSSATGSISSFSDPPTQGNPATVISTRLRCFAFLSDGAGRPIVGRRIIFVPLATLAVEDSDDNVYGVLPGIDRLETITDERGFAEIFLIRGQTFKVFFEGTIIQRQITIPATGTELNLLTAVSAAADPFTIVQAPPMPIRNS